MIPRLGPRPDAPFPPPDAALDEPDGLLAWGGDLHPDRLLRAYAQGIFPWFSEEDPILWWSPSRRCLLPTAAVRISRRLRRSLRQRRYRFTMDTAFSAVVDGCIAARSSTWISPDMREAYVGLHRLGHGHAIEVWRDEQLVAGLYGLAIGHMFAGESMFTRERDASKMAMAALCRALAAWDYPWLDCQLSNPHLLSMGACELSREAFLRTLAESTARPALPGSWSRRFAALQLDSANW